MDKDTRNRIQKATQAARGLLEQDFEEQLAGVFDIRADGTVAEGPGAHLDAAQRIVRGKLVAAVAHLRASGQTAAEAVATYRREAAFTTLNRFVALKMLEARGLVQECISRGEQSSGFKEFGGLAPGLVQLPDRGYRLYLECLFDEIGREVRVLFDRRDPASLLWPGRATLLGSQPQRGLLEILNDPELAGIWDQDETIGWVYQYYNDPSERKRMRDESAAPRNSRELAVRNQFFTPRYVVEFLTDNSLGRTWYEMTHGETRLKDQCRYLVRGGEESPVASRQSSGRESSVISHQSSVVSGRRFSRRPRTDDATPHRPLKDPRTIRMLDPACGSMHFGLYAFDLFQVIYEEAWELDLTSHPGRGARGDGLQPLRSLYVTKDDYLRDAPRLILEHNIHGIDIDPRAAQIAGLALWLRAQRAWQGQGVQRQDRPCIRRSNVVCAEPMPGEGAYLDEFIAAQLSATPEDRLLGQLVRRVFAAMRLAGEAGSLLKIEDEIAGALTEARQQWLAGPKPKQLGLFGDDTPAPEQLALGLDVTGITDAAFWEGAEGRIYAALQGYAERAENGGGYQRRLFAEDVARGFAFIDLCRQRYDVVLMNPPFGDASLPSKPYIEETYGDTKGDVYKAFVECFQARLIPAGYLGIISSRTGFFLGQSEDWRTRVVLRLYRPICLADLGSGVLDAMVEVAAYVLRSLSKTEARDLTLSLVPVLDRVVRDKQDRFSLPKWQVARDGLKRHQAVAELEHLEGHGFIKRSSGDIVRYAPVWQAVKTVSAPPEPAFPPLVCVRALAVEDKGRLLVTAICGTGKASMFVCDPGGFKRLPSTTFAYWVGPKILSLFGSLPSLQSDDQEAVFGGSSKDDFRYLRLSWEVSCESIARSRQETTDGRIWVSYAKGGAFAHYYSDLHLTIQWANDGRETKASISEYRGSRGWGYQWTAALNGHSHYFRCGLTWPRRTNGLSFRALPSGCIFGDKGPAVFVNGDDNERLLAVNAIVSSRIFSGLVALQLARVELAQSFEVGLIQRTPFPILTGQIEQYLADSVRRAWIQIREKDGSVSTSHAFLLPGLLAMSGRTLVERVVAWAARLRTSEETVAAIQAEIDDLAFRLYGLDAEDRAALTATLATEAIADAAPETDQIGEDEADEVATADSPTLTADLLAYALGCAFGRWDIRYATGECPAPQAPDPFAPLPVCPPGQLQNAQGLPAGPDDLPASYPVEIPWDGILVEDAGHDRDLVARGRRVFDVVFADGAEAAWQEAGEILQGGGDALRPWFARSCFADHIKRYSKSRRKAPIYWQLATPSASYSVWLYYHRFTKDTFYKVLNDFVTPKLQHEERKLVALVQDGGANPTGGQRTEIAEQEGLVAELRAFREEVARVAPLWNPDFNDGVIINFAPLWRLVPQHRTWQKECKDCWDKLVAGDYDWAHLAMHLWPERVVPKCATDRSLAIAHGLEAALWEEGANGKWQPRAVPRAELDRLIAERTAPAVKDALRALLEAPAAVTGRGAGRRSGPGGAGRHAAAPPRSTPGTSASPAMPDGAVLAAIRQAIAAAGGSAGKAEVFAATGLADAQWNVAIAALLAAGTVTKTGAARGTRYHLSANA
jgi:hypothetical protein